MGFYSHLSNEELMELLSHLLEEARERDLIRDRPHLSELGRKVGNNLLLKYSIKIGGE